MELLELVQSLHYEAKLPGSPPSAVTGQSGRAADLVRWTIEAYNDIQREKDSRWKWLRSSWFVNTTSGDQSYEPGDCTDVATDSAITRFLAWNLDDEEEPFIYLVSDGVATERELPLFPWPEFRSLYVKGSHTASFPAQMSVDYADSIFLGPKPDDIYRVSGYYWKSIQELAADDDEPEMPANYHMLIVYRALVKYGYAIVGQEILARARTDGQPLYDALVLNQWYGRNRLRLPGPLA
ncbi:hypothetical protein LCGC14_2368090 [marine sediment metagenome]|uniref:Uncharacterized protein n=1 Tax=marine sediment metagenome TaxID=412755 RepID=A0A0F9EZA8_9ZZZZ